MPHFNTAIVRTPCNNLIHGLTSANLGQPDYKKALAQHEQYIHALESCGLNVIVLPPDNNFPDSVFIEDAALCTPHCAVITNPGALSRKGEVENMEEILQPYYNTIHRIEDPGTLEAGDVMMADDHYYIGLSGRTNRAGALQLLNILQHHHLTGSMISIKEVLHLKSAVAYLGENMLIGYGKLLGVEQFHSYRVLEIPMEEAYAANCIRVNDRVIVPDGFPQTRKIIEDAGFQTLPVDVSEFRKLDGGLSCLSLRF